MQPINWFPGHMHKARKEIAKVVSKVDFVIEVLDARLPFSSENPIVPGLLDGKPVLKVLNKSDLADPERTDAWLAWFNARDGVTAMPLHQKQSADRLLKSGRGMLPAERNASRPLRAMILGVPNVGKSTIINILAGRTIAKTGNKPAVTKQQQRIPVGMNVILLDTPGFLWPRLHPPECGYRLATSGAVAQGIVDYESMAWYLVAYLAREYPQLLKARYGLDELAEGEEPLLEQIAQRRGCMRRGGVADLHKVSELLIREFRAGTIGRITLETP